MPFRWNDKSCRNVPFRIIRIFNALENKESPFLEKKFVHFEEKYRNSLLFRCNVILCTLMALTKIKKCLT